MRELISCQEMLYGWILTLVADRDFADEVLQETNLTLIRREAEFPPDGNFTDWAHSQAFYQVLTFRRRKQRNKLVFDNDLVRLLAEDTQQQSPSEDKRRESLKDCLSLLSDAQRSVLERRYSGRGVREIAAAEGRSEAAISQALYQLRKTLRECIQRKLAAEPSS